MERSVQRREHSLAQYFGGWDDSEVRKLFGIQSIPHIILVGKDGKIVGKNLRRNLLRDKIIELLNK